jgi:hypothetical protein
MPPRESNRRSSIEHDRDPTWWSSSSWIIREERRSRAEDLLGGLAACDTAPCLIMDEFTIVNFDESIDEIPASVGIELRTAEGGWYLDCKYVCFHKAAATFAI